MKISFYNNFTGFTVFTIELLKHISVIYGHSVTDHKDSDIMCLSLTSHYEIPELIKARKQFPKKKIIVGGHISNAPACLLAYADFVNLGQGFEFFKTLKSIEEINQMPFIVSKEKKEGEYSSFIDWSIIPIVRISQNSYSYLESVGCRNKCTFCLTSWMNRFQQNPNQKAIQAISRKYEGKQLYLIGNNYESQSCNLKVSDCTIKGYNENSTKYNKIRLIRVGLESVTETTRFELKKRITDEDIKEFIQRTKFYKKNANIFLIAGLNQQEEFENFTEILGEDYGVSPKLNFIINYFDPSRLTPLQNFDLSKLIPINIPKIKRLWKTQNGRVVIFRDHTISWKNSTFDSVMQRIDEMKVAKLLELKKEKYESFDQMIDVLKHKGFEREIMGNFKYPIKTNYPYNFKNV